MTLTKEQIGAAKALVARGADTNRMGLLIAAETLLKALEAAEEDSARLDWMEAHKETSYNPPALSRVALGWPLGTSLRDAIDAAIKNEKE